MGGRILYSSSGDIARSSSRLQGDGDLDIDLWRPCPLMNVATVVVLMFEESLHGEAYHTSQVNVSP